MLKQFEERYENLSQVVEEKEHIINQMSYKKCENTSGVEILDVYSFLGFYVAYFVCFYITDFCYI